MPSKLKSLSFAIILHALTTQIVTAQSPTVVINEFIYDIPSANYLIEYKNIGTETFDMTHWSTCSGSTCIELDIFIVGGGDLILEPSEIITVSQDFVFETGPAGYFALVDEDLDLIDFVQYGSDNLFERSAEAVAEGFWSEPMPGSYDFVPTTAPGDSSSWCGTAADGQLTLSTSFINREPTLGFENNNCPGIFADSFESGDFGGWSSSSPQ